MHHLKSVPMKKQSPSVDLTEFLKVREWSEHVPSFKRLPHLKQRNVRVVTPWGPMGRAPKIELMIKQHVKWKDRPKRGLNESTNEAKLPPKENDGERPLVTFESTRNRKRNVLATHGPARATRYIAKVGERNYPVESITEQLHTVLGRAIGVSMAETELVCYRGRLMLLSKVFLKRNEILVHGAQILGRYLQDDGFVKVDLQRRKKEARNIIYLTDVECAVKSEYQDHHEDLLHGFYKILLFDAWTGCHDRHLFNWGVIEHVDGKKDPVIAPCYDSARGLFWRESEDNLKRKYRGPNASQQFDKFMLNAMPEIGIDSSQIANHLQLAEYILTTRGARILDWARQHLTRDAVSLAVDSVKSEFGMYLSGVRLECIERILWKRFEKLYHYIR